MGPALLENLRRLRRCFGAAAVSQTSAWEWYCFDRFLAQRMQQGAASDLRRMSPARWKRLPHPSSRLRPHLTCRPGHTSAACIPRVWLHACSPPGRRHRERIRVRNPLKFPFTNAISGHASYSIRARSIRLWESYFRLARFRLNSKARELHLIVPRDSVRRERVRRQISYVHGCMEVVVCFTLNTSEAEVTSTSMLFRT